MKHDSASEMRAALARRITQRALDATKHARLEILPMGEPERTMSPRDYEVSRRGELWKSVIFLMRSRSNGSIR